MSNQVPTTLHQQVSPKPVTKENVFAGVTNETILIASFTILILLYAAGIWMSIDTSGEDGSHSGPAGPKIVPSAASSVAAGIISKD